MFVCMYGHHIHVALTETRTALDPLGLELYTVVSSHHESVEKSTQVLWKSST